MKYNLILIFLGFIFLSGFVFSHDFFVTDNTGVTLETSYYLGYFNENIIFTNEIDFPKKILMIGPDSPEPEIIYEFDHDSYLKIQTCSEELYILDSSAWPNKKLVKITKNGLKTTHYLPESVYSLNRQGCYGSDFYFKVNSKLCKSTQGDLNYFCYEEKDYSFSSPIECGGDLYANHWEYGFLKSPQGKYDFNINDDFKTGSANGTINSFFCNDFYTEQNNLYRGAVEQNDLYWITSNNLLFKSIEGDNNYYPLGNISRITDSYVVFGKTVNKSGYFSGEDFYWENENGIYKSISGENEAVFLSENQFVFDVRWEDGGGVTHPVHFNQNNDDAYIINSNGTNLVISKSVQDSNKLIDIIEFPDRTRFYSIDFGFLGNDTYFIASTIPLGSTGQYFNNRDHNFYKIVGDEIAYLGVVEIMMADFLENAPNNNATYSYFSNDVFYYTKGDSKSWKINYNSLSPHYIGQNLSINKPAIMNNPYVIYPVSSPPSNGYFFIPNSYSNCSYQKYEVTPSTSNSLSLFGYNICDKPYFIHEQSLIDYPYTTNWFLAKADNCNFSDVGPYEVHKKNWVCGEATYWTSYQDDYEIDYLYKSGKNSNAGLFLTRIDALSSTTPFPFDCASGKAIFYNKENKTLYYSDENNVLNIISQDLNFISTPNWNGTSFLHTKGYEFYNNERNKTVFISTLNDELFLIDKDGELKFISEIDFIPQKQSNPPNRMGFCGSDFYFEKNNMLYKVRDNSEIISLGNGNLTYAGCNSEKGNLPAYAFLNENTTSSSKTIWISFEDSNTYQVVNSEMNNFATGFFRTLGYGYEKVNSKQIVDFSISTHSNLEGERYTQYNLPYCQEKYLLGCSAPPSNSSFVDVELEYPYKFYTTTKLVEKNAVSPYEYYTYFELTGNQFPKSFCEAKCDYGFHRENKICVPNEQINPIPICGDGICGFGENNENCSQDCLILICEEDGICNPDCDYDPDCENCVDDDICVDGCTPPDPDCDTTTPVCGNEIIEEGEECEIGFSCDEENECIGCKCYPSGTQKNSIINLTGKASLNFLDGNITCDNETNAKLSLIDFENNIISEINILCSASDYNFVLDNPLIENKIYSVLAQIEEPCEVCSKSIFISQKSNTSQIAIPDNSIISIVLVLFFVLGLITKKRI